MKLLLALGAAIAASGCFVESAHPDVDTSKPPVDREVAVQDSAPETSEGTRDTEVATEPDECGIDPLTGDYREPCAVEYDKDSWSTLCDDLTHRCVPPEASCTSGWCRIPARSFVGGATDEATWIGLESEPRSIMLVPRSFEIMETEVTVEMFLTLMGYLPNAVAQCGNNCPVAGVNIFEAMLYANEMSELNHYEHCYTLTGCQTEEVTWNGYTYPIRMCESSVFSGPECTGFRLASGREYELAARAGSPNCLSRGRLSNNPAPGDCGPRDAKSWPHLLATFCGNSGTADDYCVFQCAGRPDGGETGCAAIPFVPEVDGSVCLGPQDVRSRAPNPFGLYGMHGNIAEWTQTSRQDTTDLFARVANEESREIATSPEFESLVHRGTPMLTFGTGYWDNIAGSCGNRLQLTHENLARIAHLQLYGLRLVRTVR